jgi:hypothetical protein
MRREKEKRDGEEKEFFRSFRSRFARTIAQHEHGNRAALVGALPVAHLISVVYKRQRETEREREPCVLRVLSIL